MIEGDWAADTLDLHPDQKAHLERVLRIQAGEALSYTDGRGRSGLGTYRGGALVRDEEKVVPRPSDLTVVVAPPDNRERQRFLVEKLSELGVAALEFLETRHGKGRPPRHDRARAWAVSALEQSRGAWLMTVGTGTLTLDQLGADVAMCDPQGSIDPPLARTVVIGPEGGWAPEEVEQAAQLWSLGSTVLRVETAAIVAASRLV